VLLSNPFCQLVPVDVVEEFTTGEKFQNKNKGLLSNGKCVVRCLSWVWTGSKKVGAEREG